ncbi:MAG: hypothetical protein HYR84_15835 [Planctomycetes bacterium]|nr:hypothetical protein [Planctomycetota bacterium]
MSLSRLRAAAEHGGIVADPPLDQVDRMLGANGRVLRKSAVSILGNSLSDLRVLARREIARESIRYHHESGEEAADGTFWEDGPCFAAGHQPELFHPGVWFKNFALHQLAHRHNASALYLIVDTDVAKPALLDAPAGDHVARVPFDRSSAETPYEERQVEDESTFASVFSRVKSLASDWTWTPMFDAFWNEVMKQSGGTHLVGERFARARRAMERRWGVAQRELPMSRVCDTDAFAWFACAILQELPRFRDCYNRVVADYRQEHGIRSRSHPVPELGKEDGWLEAPFWAWRSGQRRRGKLFVRRSADAWELRVGGDLWPTLPIDDPLEAWSAMRRQGLKIRSRAMTTTMFARLFVADLFIHGIGGAVYDALTDGIIERFFEEPAPGFLVLSATLLLPLPRYPEAEQQSRQLERRQRDLIYKPELFAERTGETGAFAKAKQGWIEGDCSTHEARAKRFARIRGINAELAPFVRADVEQCDAELAECRRLIARDQVARRRDYPFCLYPEEMLRNFFVNPIR